MMSHLIETPADKIVRQSTSIEEIRSHTVLSEETKTFLIDKIVNDLQPHCKVCDTVVFFPMLAQTLDVQSSGHIGFWCSRDCGETGIETDLNWKL